MAIRRSGDDHEAVESPNDMPIQTSNSVDALLEGGCENVYEMFDERQLSLFLNKILYQTV